MSKNPKHKKSLPEKKESNTATIYNIVGGALGLNGGNDKSKKTKKAKKKGNGATVEESRTVNDEDKQKKGKKTPKNTARKTPSKTQEASVLPQLSKKEEEPEETEFIPEPWKSAPLNPEIEAAMAAFVKHHTTLGVMGLRDEFTQWKGWVPPLFAYETFNANIEKNRYRDVVCLDHTRIPLTLFVPPESDYIHANTVKHEGADKVFITTQGPLENTIGDHWRLIHQEGASVIVALCQFVEAGKAKCAPYWPMKESEYCTYGKMFINNKKVVQDLGFDIYTIEALPEGCSNSTICKLIHMTTWPDRGVPTDPKCLLKILKLMYQNCQGSIVVHCSAGIGRTGTIVGVDIIVERLLKGKESKLVDIFQSLRSQRASSIQTEAQYVLVVQVVLEFIRIRTGKMYADVIKTFGEEVIKANLA